MNINRKLKILRAMPSISKVDTLLGGLLVTFDDGVRTLFSPELLLEALEKADERTTKSSIYLDRCRRIKG